MSEYLIVAFDKENCIPRLRNLRLLLLYASCNGDDQSANAYDDRQNV